jgi:addiction module HigA family antidote
MHMASKSRTTTEIERKGAAAWVIHPGEILREEFLAPLEMTAYALAKAIQVPVPRIHDVIAEKRAVSPDTALRLARFFSTTEEFWMNLQAAYDLAVARKTAGRAIAKIKPRVVA